MFNREYFFALLQKLLIFDHNVQSNVLKKIASMIQHVDEEELVGFLEILNATNDTDLQVKMYAVLSTYLRQNNTYCHVIIKRSYVYDHIHKILKSGPNQKATIAMNFLSSLLHITDDGETGTRRSDLVMLAHNMIRNTGCLMDMLQMFSSNIQPLEVWDALCRCLSETCRGCRSNQEFCSSLLPICIQKIKQGNVNLFSMVYSLLYNNDKNIEIFLDHDGVSVLTREMLQNDACMQIVTVLARSPMGADVIRNSHLGQNLHNIFKIYEPYVKMGHWATDILHHVDSNTNSDAMLSSQGNDVRGNEIKHSVDFSFLNEIEPDDSMRDIANQIDKTQIQSLMNSTNGTNSIRQNYPDMFQDTSSPSNEHELFLEDITFSFAMNENLMKFPLQNDIDGESCEESNENIDNTYNDISWNYNNDLKNYKHINLMKFNPPFFSTPKTKFRKAYDRSLKGIRNHKLHPLFENNWRNPKTNTDCKTKIRNKLNTSENAKIKERSLGIKLMTLINDSFHIFVTAFKNLLNFKEKLSLRSDESQNENKKELITNIQCNLSFTKYMMKRDAILAHEDTNTENSCKTCDDTKELERKLETDEYLQATMRKLKLGINIYGCDFKKISRTMWPQETHMSPIVLYNLYRKLIEK